MAASTRATILMIKNKVKVYSLGQTEENTTENGKTENNTESAFTTQARVK